MSDKKGKIRGAVTTTTALALSALVLSMAMLAGWVSLNPYAAAADYTYEPEIGMYAHIEYTRTYDWQPGICSNSHILRVDTLFADVPLYIVKDGSSMYTSSQPNGSVEAVPQGTYTLDFDERDNCAKKTCVDENNSENILVRMVVDFDKSTGIIQVTRIGVDPADTQTLTIRCDYDSGQVSRSTTPMYGFDYPDAFYGDPDTTDFYIPPDSPSTLSVARANPEHYLSDGIKITFTPVPSNQDFSVSCNALPEVPKGKTAETICYVESIGGFNKPVDLKCDAPSESKLTCGLAPSTVSPPADGRADVILGVTAANDSPPGEYVLEITGTSGELTHSTTVLCKVPVCDPEEVKKAEQFFQDYIDTWTSRGWDVAVDNLKQFLEGTGPNPKTIGVEWLRSFGVVQDAEERIQNYYENALGDEAKKLKSGKSITLNPTDKCCFWDADISTGLPTEEYFWAIGHSDLHSDGKFVLERKGYTVTVNGVADFYWSDLYNFDPGQPGYEEAEILKKCKDPAPAEYRMEAHWKMKVTGKITFPKNPQLTSPSVALTWTLT